MVAILLAVSGCTGKKLHYSWGSYHQIAYAVMQGEVDPQQAVTAMEEQLTKIKAEGGIVPPGFHGQLGMLYAQIGNDERMLAEFHEESRLYPESENYMNFLLSPKGSKESKGEKNDQ